MGVDDVEALCLGVSCAGRSRPSGRQLFRLASNANTVTSMPSIRRSASTWSRTKLPSAGRAGVGYMLVTTNARTVGGPAYPPEASALGGSNQFLTRLWHHAAAWPQSRSSRSACSIPVSVD